MYEKQAELVRRLYEKTTLGEVEWKKTASDDAFQSSFKNSSVRVASTKLQTQTLFTVELLNKDGDVADSFDDSDLDTEMFGEVNRENYQKLREIFEMARRHAQGADKVLNEILKALDDDIPF
jgi:hypothetical protein